MSARIGRERALRVPHLDDLAGSRAFRYKPHGHPLSGRSTAAAAPPSGRWRRGPGVEQGRQRERGAERRRAAEAAQDAGHVGARLARPLAARHRRPARRCRRPSAVAMSPPCSLEQRRASGAPGRRSPGPGSNGLCPRCGFHAPAHVAGMNCAMPCAPAGERADGVEAALGLELRREQRRRQLLGARGARDERPQLRRARRRARRGRRRPVALAPGSSRRPAPVQPPSPSGSTCTRAPRCGASTASPGATTRPT